MCNHSRAVIMEFNTKKGERISRKPVFLYEVISVGGETRFRGTLF